MIQRGKRILRSGLCAGLLAGVLGSAVIATSGMAAERREHANILLAYAQRRLLPALVELDEGIRSTIQTESPRPVTFHTAFLDLDGALGIRSLVAIPLAIGGSVVGALMCSHLRSAREWPEALLGRLDLLGDIFANALARKQSEAAVRESKALAGTIFTSLYGHVAAVDRDGVIIAVNESWTRFARDNGGDPARVSVGASYLDALRSAAGRGDLDACRSLEAIESVLEGRTGSRTADCLVLDVHLGGLSGLDRQDGLARSGASLPVIFITAHDDGPTRERARRSGAVDYLTKPFDEEALIDAINRAIGRT